MQFVQSARTQAKIIGLNALGRVLRHASPRVNVVSPLRDFDRKAGALHALLSARGFPAVLTPRESLAARGMLRARHSDVAVGFWNSFPDFYIPQKFIFYNAEPLGIGEWRDDKEYLAVLERADEVWNYHEMAEPKLRLHRPTWRKVPFGYCEFYQREYARSVGPSFPESYDVMFVGGITPRRERVLQRLRDAGLSVLAITRDNALHGDDLDRAIASARLIIHIHRFDDKRAHVADLARLDFLLSNSRCIVHEVTTGVDDPPGFSDALPLVAEGELVAACQRFVSDPGLRARTAARSHEWFRATLDMDSYLPYDSVERLLQQR